MIETTVILATRNGAHVLPRTLQGYADLARLQPSGWKLVVVDNGSTDSTPEILARYEHQLPLRRLEQPLAGKNRALNLALGEIEGDCVILTDDDAVPQPGFLSAWRQALKENPGYDVFGGTILPLFEATPPAWMLESERHFDALFAMRKGDDGPVEPFYIFGPNMAVRAKLFAGGMKFNEGIGPNADDSNYAMGSETDLCVRASNAGHKTWFASKPMVHHIVRAQQVTPEFWARRAYRLGRGTAQIQWESGALMPQPRQPGLGTLIVKVWRRSGLRRLFDAVDRGRMYLPTLHPSEPRRFEAVWDYQWFCGFRDEYNRRRERYFAAQASTAARSTSTSKAI